MVLSVSLHKLAFASGTAVSLPETTANVNNASQIFFSEASLPNQRRRWFRENRRLHDYLGKIRVARVLRATNYALYIADYIWQDADKFWCHSLTLYTGLCVLLFRAYKFTEVVTSHGTHGFRNQDDIHDQLKREWDPRRTSCLRNPEPLAQTAVPLTSALKRKPALKIKRNENYNRSRRASAYTLIQNTLWCPRSLKSDTTSMESISLCVYVETSPFSLQSWSHFDKVRTNIDSNLSISVSIPLRSSTVSLVSKSIRMYISLRT